MIEQARLINDLVLKIPLSALWIIFGIFMILVILAGWALIYHWTKYRAHIVSKNITTIVYLVGLVVLITSSVISLLFFSAQQ